MVNFLKNIGFAQRHVFLTFIFLIKGRPSSSGRAQKDVDDVNLQRSQTFGQRFMDNLFLRNLTSQPKSSVAEVTVPSSPYKVFCTCTTFLPFDVPY